MQRAEKSEEKGNFREEKWSTRKPGHVHVGPFARWPK